MTNMEEKDDNWTPESYPIPEHWIYTELKTAFQNLPLTGKKLAQKNYDPDGEIPVIDQGAAEIGGYSNDQEKLIKPDRPVIIFGDHTKCLKYIAFPFIPGADGIKVLLPNLGIEPKFAFYACKSLRLPDRGYSRHYSFLKKCDFPLPPFNEQKRIVAKIEELFSELDNGITALKTAREQLKVYRQAVLKHAFEGKLTAKWREENTDKLESPEQLFARIQQEREARHQQQLEDWKLAVKAWEISGKERKKPGKPKIAKLPKNIEQEIAQINSIQGWYLAPLEVLITEINQGWSPKCELNRTPNDWEWAVIKTSALQPLQYISEECKPLPPEFEPRPGLEVQVGDILMTRKGPRIRTGVVCLVKETRKNSMLCDTVYRFRAIDKAVDSEFLELALNSPAIVSELDQRKSGISDSGISLNHGKLKSIPIPISSSFEEQKLVVSLIREKVEYINRMDLEIDNQLLRSETLRQSILKKAFSGQLVPQDPNDEPASELLARIQAEIEAAKVTNTKKTRTAK